MRKLVLAAAALMMTATANASVTQASPQKICPERYNAENASGTIPYRMSKTNYINQCTGSIRRAAKLEQELADGTAATDDVGANEVTPRDNTRETRRHDQQALARTNHAEPRPERQLVSVPPHRRCPSSVSPPSRRATFSHLATGEGQCNS